MENVKRNVELGPFVVVKSDKVQLKLFTQDLELPNSQLICGLATVAMGDSWPGCLGY